MCRVVTSQPRGSRGSWCNIEIDRLDARPGQSSFEACAGLLTAGAGNSIFRQVFNELRLQEMHTHTDMFRGATQQMWYIDFTGEQSMDWGGAFRESFVNLGQVASAGSCPSEPRLGAQDICSENNELLLRVPNYADNDGFHQDTWIPNPDCQAMEQYEFVGRLMAAAILSDESLPLQLPPMVWKQIAGMRTCENDLREIDLTWCRNMDQVPPGCRLCFNLVYVLRCGVAR